MGGSPVRGTEGTTRMKRSIFATTIFALATAGAAPLLAQTAIRQ